ncbi:MAG: DUF2782 domain-containing protein [Mariprofundaceae bacterium]
MLKSSENISRHLVSTISGLLTWSISVQRQCLALLLGLCVSISFVAPVQAEDAESALPPPTEIQDGPAALETAERPTRNSGARLSEELSVPDDQSNVEVRSYKRKDGTKIEEYSHHGRVYMVKVTPSGGLPPYYLYDNNGDGEFARHLPGGAKGITPPEWVIQRF